MRITKFNHSCLVVEQNGMCVIIDPGNYSLEVLNVNDVPRLDYLLITHAHQDHCDIPLIKALMAKFPNARVITNNSVKEMLAKEGITAMTQGDMNVALTPVPHEKIWMSTTPTENTMITLFGKLSHPGDSLSMQQTAEILALPISGPWCNTTQAVEVAAKLKPKIIIPIHDFQWKDDFRQAMHQRLQEYFRPLGIDFRPIELGDIIEI